MQVAQKLLTAEEFMLLPEPDDGSRMELFDGEVVCMPPTGQEHGQIAGDAYAALRVFSRLHKLGLAQVETGFVLRRNPDRVVGPDASFVANERLRPDTDLTKFIEGPPTLAVEVVSPNDLDRDVDAKVAEYLEAGTQRVWVVRPLGRTVTVHRPNGDLHRYTVGDTLTSDDAAFAVDGFVLPLAELFGDD